MIEVDILILWYMIVNSGMNYKGCWKMVMGV